MSLMYVFYHFPCNDGELAKIIWELKYPKSIFIKWNHMEADIAIDFLNNIKEQSDIIFLDVCPSCILPSIHNYTVIDHHLNPINNMNKYIEKNNLTNVNMLCDVSKSGCMLSWEYCYDKKKYPIIVHHIGNKDLWNFNDINTEPYCIGYNNHLYANKNNREYIIKSLLISDTTCYHEMFISDGIKTIVDKITLAEQYFLEKTFSIETVDDINYNIIDINCDDSSMFKYLIDYAAGEFINIDILRILHTKKDNKTVYSLRSLKENIFVDGIARKYGGNGHPKAAGYTLIDA